MTRLRALVRRIFFRDLDDQHPIEGVTFPGEQP